MVKPRSTKNKMEDLPETRQEVREPVGDAERNALAEHTAAILAAIKDTKTSLEAQIAAVVNEVGILRDQQKKLTD